jgi:superfamily I DNA/RNA helicase
MLTIHAAKGLEFPVVFVVGLEDGLTPFSWGAPRGDDAPDEDQEKSAAEERRLFYVAVTRAKDRLFLSRAIQRSWRGQLRSLPPSRFLKDIQPRLTVQHAVAFRKQRDEKRQYSLF